MDGTEAGHHVPGHAEFVANHVTRVPGLVSSGAGVSGIAATVAEGRVSAAMAPREPVQGGQALARIQPAHGWSGSRGRNAPRRGCRGAKALAHGEAS